MKVMSDWSIDEIMANAGRERPTVAGYVTQAKYLYGLTAPQIEVALGLRRFELRDIAFVHGLDELPAPSDFEFRLFAVFPDGKVATDYDRGRQDDLAIERSYHPVGRVYRPGSEMVPQWKLTGPVRLGPRLGIASRDAPFRRENGSDLIYREHGRRSVV